MKASIAESETDATARADLEAVNQKFRFKNTPTSELRSVKK